MWPRSADTIVWGAGNSFWKAAGGVGPSRGQSHDGTNDPGNTAATCVWSHGGESCKRSGEAHPNTAILLVVTVKIPDSGKVFELQCPYISAATGEGSSCRGAAADAPRYEVARLPSNVMARSQSEIMRLMHGGQIGA